MTDTNGNGQQPTPMLGGFPLLSQPVPWSYEIHQVARDDSSGEKVFVIRLRLPTGPLDLWAPASFVKDFGEKMVGLGAGLHIARDVPPQ